MSADHREELLVAERTADWLHRLPTAGPEERMAFIRWLKESPRHVREILLATTWDQVLRCIDPERRWDIDALAAQPSNVVPVQPSHLAAADRLQHVHPAKEPPADTAKEEDTSHINGLLRWPKPPMPGSRDGYSWKVAAAFAVVALLPVLTLMAKVVWLDRVIATDASEWRTTTLTDGSVVRIGPRTRLRIELGDKQRSIHLSRGEAVFQVAKDPARPFFVNTELAIARAVGTQFGVSHVANSVVVTVSEGAVAVSQVGRHGVTDRGQAGPHDNTSVTLSAGEQVAVTTASPLAVRRVNAPSELAWADGWLIFEGTSVADAVREFNRRNRTQIEIADPALATRPVRGMFKAADPKSFVEFLKGQGSVSVLREKPGTLRMEPGGSSR